MIKTFITVISENKPEDLKPTRYIAPEDEKIFYDNEIKFPILAAINAYAENNDEIKIIAIINEENLNTVENYNNSFVPALEELKAEKNLIGLDTSKIIKVTAKSDQGINANLQLVEDLLAVIGDNEILHACITFGTKPLPIIIFMALNYIYKVKNNTDIETIVYGTRYSGDRSKFSIYDVTSLFYTNEMFMNLANAGVVDPVGKVKAMRETFED